MREIEITTRIIEKDYDELDESMQRLVECARRATYRSYAPYSHFSVGAAILLSDGEIIEGSNQENAAFPSGLCAERCAAYYAHAHNPDCAFEAIAIAARGTCGDFTVDAIAPCGACRQALLEYEKLAGNDVKVLLCSSSKVLIIESVKSLLPLSFVEFA